MLPSPHMSGLGLRISVFCRGHHWVHSRCGPVTRSPSRGWLCRSASSVSFPHSTDTTHATGLLTIAPEGLAPTEHACLSLDALRFENSAKQGSPRIGWRCLRPGLCLANI